jgi:TonB family protein
MRAFALGWIATALVSFPASAREWPDAGGWTIAESDNACGLMQEFEGKGETELVLVASNDGKIGLSVRNAGWSPTEGQDYDLDFVLNGRSYGGGGAVGLADGYKKGFAAAFGDDFMRDFASGTSLLIYRGETLVDQLSLKGTAAGVAMLRRCLSAIKADKAAADREMQRFAHIADDPFAAKPTDSTEAPDADIPKPRIDPENWFSDADYPSRAQREERSGTTGYRLEVGADGRIHDCTVTSSSGHADLDEATCRLIRMRGRFSGSGGSYNGKRVWRLPG